MHPDLEFIKEAEARAVIEFSVSMNVDDFDRLMHIAELAPYRPRSGMHVRLDFGAFHDLIHRATAHTHDRIAAIVAAKLKAAS